METVEHVEKLTSLEMWTNIDWTASCVHHEGAPEVQPTIVTTPMDNGVEQFLILTSTQRAIVAKARNG